MASAVPLRTLFAKSAALLGASLVGLLAWLATELWYRVEANEQAITSEQLRSTANSAATEATLRQMEHRLGRMEAKMDALPSEILRLMEQQRGRF